MPLYRHFFFESEVRDVVCPCTPYLSVRNQFNENHTPVGIGTLIGQCYCFYTLALSHGLRATSGRQPDLCVAALYTDERCQSGGERENRLVHVLDRFNSQ